MEFFKKTPNIAFMANRRWCYVVSTILILGSAVLLATRGLNLGIEFTGGAELELRYPDVADVGKAKEVIEKAGYPEANVAPLGAGRDILVRTEVGEGETAREVGEKILSALKTTEPTIELRRQDQVYPQVGRELSEKGGLALLFTFIMISIYVGFRFEKKMAAGTVFAAMHDPIVILGFFSLTQFTFDLSVLAAVLAVIGYSINDTVVVFDRVRENFLGMRKVAPAEIINTSVNQTLSRTLMTSFSTLSVVVSLYLFGGNTLKGFAAAIIVGVLVGTYSSIFVAGALALDMKLSATDLVPPPKEKDEIDALP